MFVLCVCANVIQILNVPDGGGLEKKIFSDLHKIRFCELKHKAC